MYVFLFLYSLNNAFSKLHLIRRLVSIGIDRDTDTVSAILFQYRYRYRRYFSTGVTQVVSAILLGPIFTDNRYRYFVSRSSLGSAANDDNFEKKM